MENYMEVPDMISCKDLDYLSDMYEWNYISFKKTKDMVDKCMDEDIKRVLDDGCVMFLDNMKLVLDILGGDNNE